MIGNARVETWMLANYAAEHVVLIGCGWPLSNQEEVNSQSSHPHHR